MVDFGGEHEFGIFEATDEEEFEAFAIEAIRANHEVLGGL
jgi:hypothetical protein